MMLFIFLSLFFHISPTLTASDINQTESISTKVDAEYEDLLQKIPTMFDEEERKQIQIKVENEDEKKGVSLFLSEQFIKERLENKRKEHDGSNANLIRITLASFTANALSYFGLVPPIYGMLDLFLTGCVVADAKYPVTLFHAVGGSMLGYMFSIPFFQGERFEKAKAMSHKYSLPEISREQYIFAIMITGTLLGIVKQTILKGLHVLYHMTII